MILINDFRFIIIYRYYWLLFLLVTPNIKGDYRNYTNYSNYVNDRICSESRWNGHFFNGQKQKIKKTPLNFSKAIGSKDFGLCLRSLGAQVLTIFDHLRPKRLAETMYDVRPAPSPHCLDSPWSWRAGTLQTYQRLMVQMMQMQQWQPPQCQPPSPIQFQRPQAPLIPIQPPSLPQLAQ